MKTCLGEGISGNETFPSRRGYVLDVFRLYDKNLNFAKRAKGHEGNRKYFRVFAVGFPVQKFHNSPCKLKSSCGIIITNVSYFFEYTLTFRYPV